jgi:hypothetical protein
MIQIEQKIKMLSPELQHEVEDFIEFLIQRKKIKSGKKLRQDWAGKLRDFRDQYTSIELQKKSLDWRGD